MSHRAHLFSLRIGHALRESCFSETYNVQRLARDVLAGITIGIIAIPLAMALAIASGVAPQYGLYTAAIAGFLIALTGGSRYSISGPTAAFVVILYPIAQKYGLSGLLMATVMAGLLMILMAFLRLGRFIEYIPESVTLGFTGGIAVVIATLQMKDFFALTIEEMPESYLGKVEVLVSALPDAHWSGVSVAILTLAIMLIWPKLRTPVPAHLPAVVIGSLAAWGLNQAGFPIDTIGSRFYFTYLDGTQGQGIPPFLPAFEWPWLQPGPGGELLELNWQLLRDLLPAAFAIAMLGAIESLLCAMVLDGMTGRRHSANSELLGQGIGNVVAPFFGGITATAAIARSAANVRAAAESPVAAMVHALVVLLGLVALAGVLAYLPMPAMAAMLLMVAWNMSEAPKSLKLIRTAPKADIWVFFTCFSLTVLFDMVIAITAGIMLASFLFMKEIAEMTKITDITGNSRMVPVALPEGWSVYKITGPLFFAAADRIFGELSVLSEEKRGIVLYLDGVPILDAGGVAALSKLVSKCQRDNTRIVLADFQFQPLKTIAKAQMKPIEGVTQYFSTLREALDSLVQSEASEMPSKS
ncbi:C4-dicarboxylic acid transporter DauA [Hahella sp. CCB-MM4]|uniref:C4-dicarboxylic acid transporter DauA n=1 Tax=Hahella sp. (strain CCB-MM4) TaxID=1926491 RepID=UPI000B9BCB76|nr:C4-dicarboxylic acid transporter DauA [Hahella sp. CCB-MM4]OZG74383.1 C4-dicarboxylic acid transporter DauA [Hahella sp. CCB-MM4]